MVTSLVKKNAAINSLPKSVRCDIKTDHTNRLQRKAEADTNINKHTCWINMAEDKLDTESTAINEIKGMFTTLQSGMSNIQDKMANIQQGFDQKISYLEATLTDKLTVSLTQSIEIKIKDIVSVTIDE